MGPADGKSLFQAVETESAISVSEHLQELSGKPETSLKSAVNQRNENNQSALHISCSKLSSDVTQILLEAGADPNVQDSEGKTPAFLIISRVKGNLLPKIYCTIEIIIVPFKYFLILKRMQLRRLYKEGNSMPDNTLNSRRISGYS